MITINIRIVVAFRRKGGVVMGLGKWLASEIAGQVLFLVLGANKGLQFITY